MPKPEWGVKRTCPHCESRFYDLQREPIVCPECGTTYDVDAQGKVSATHERRAPAAAESDEEELVDEEDLVEDDDVEQEGALLEDEDEDADKPGPALSDETEEEETATFQDPALIETDDDDDDDDLENDLDLDEDKD